MIEQLLLLAAVFAIGFAAGRYRVYRVYSLQNRGEAVLAARLMENFKAPSYHLMNSVTLRRNDGTTQIDHILISRYGVYVIETKHYKGWIFANPNHSRWSQVLFKRKFRFQNPINQNFAHVRAVQSLLDFLPPETISSAVVFTGEAVFKTELPVGVYSTDRFIEHIRCQATEVMSENRMQFCIGRLEANRLALTQQTDVEHQQYVQQKHGLA
ncbi:MAG: NERD domain-containing protein [Chlorobium sp.]|nr:MAG: NERD domain-containing protein [Chlorobium sp.]